MWTELCDRCQSVEPGAGDSDLEFLHAGPKVRFTPSAQVMRWVVWVLARHPARSERRDTDMKASVGERVIIASHREGPVRDGKIVQVRMGGTPR